MVIETETTVKGRTVSARPAIISGIRARRMVREMAKMRTTEGRSTRK
jgi:hypothetical protein